MSFSADRRSWPARRPGGAWRRCHDLADALSWWPEPDRPGWPWHCRPTTTVPMCGSSTGGTQAFRPFRALILHPRTLEVLRPLGVTQALLARANIAPTADLHLGRRVIRVPARRSRAARHGLPAPVADTPDGCRDGARTGPGQPRDRGGTRHRAGRGATMARRVYGRSCGRMASSSEALFGLVAGCDGPASTVRSQAGIGWPGGPYPVEVLLADVELHR